MTTSRLAGHALVEALIEQGVDTVFGVPGESYLAVLDGLYEHRDRIRFIACRQEGGAAFMAEAQGKLTGRPGICFVTRGPGATNASIGVHTAFQDSTPMILFVGQVGADVRDREAFQEVDYRAMFGPNTGGFAKWVAEVDRPERLPEYIARAFHVAMQGRPGPVVLALPEDMLTTPTDAPVLPRVEPVHAWPAPGALRQLRHLLLQSRQPLVIAGGGGWTVQSAAALQRFAENWRLPVACAFRFQDLFDNRHPLYAGDVGIGINPRLAQRVREADLLLAVGPRLGEMTTGGYTLIEAPRPKQQLVHVHSGAEELGRVYAADLLIQSSMATAALALETLDAPGEVPWSAWTEAVHADYEANRESQPAPGPLDMAEVVKTMERVLHETGRADAIFTNGAGNYSGWLHRYYRYGGLALTGRTQLAPTSGAMGYGVPAAVAASLLQPRRTVINIAGDGDFLMTGQELATATGYGGRPIVLVVDNGTYGTIRMHQEREYPGRVSGSDLYNPDFALLARAFGWHGEFVEATEQFEPAFREALERQQPTLLHLKLDAEISTSRATLSQLRGSARR
ncbi:MAG TPA: thiamine pyrophosphate-binding protein [Burkholderiaceae bacterium]|nr:thiamine pyrophosphate-binding protein [Burkholderiaceae bacterium]